MPFHPLLLAQSQQSAATLAKTTGKKMNKFKIKMMRKSLKNKFVRPHYETYSLVFFFCVISTNETAILMCVRAAQLSMNKQKAMAMMITMAHAPQNERKKMKSTFEMRSSHHYHKVAVNVNWCLFFVVFFFSSCFPTSFLSLILIHLLRTFADGVASPILHFVTCILIIYTGTVLCACPACWVPSKGNQGKKKRKP